MAGAATTRFAARPALAVIDQLADALGWPRSRPARLLAGDRATIAAGAVLCTDETALAALDADADRIAILGTPPTSGDGRLGRRPYDPFAGSADDVASWRRAPRVVLDASLLVAGGTGGLDRRLADLVGCAPRDGATAFDAARPVRRDASKFVGYVPVGELEQVRAAVFAAGAGTIGAYDQCSWSTTGTGTFRGGDDTDPTIGTRGEFEQVEEARFETIVQDHLVASVCRAFVAAHSYEEPAFDVVPLAIPAAVGFGVRCTGPAGGLDDVARTLDDAGIAHDLVHGSTHGGAGNAIVHTGPLRDVLDAALADVDLQLIVAGEATGAETALLADRGIGLLVVHRSGVVDAFAADIAGMLTRALELPVTAQGGLAFPAGAEGAASSEAPASREEASEPSVFDQPTGADYATGTWRLHFDGGSRGNPGPAAYGWVLYDPNGDEHEADGVKIGSATNNVAEWTGLLRGLEHARARGVRNLQVRGDSELVVKQVTGVYRVKNAALKPLAEQVKILVGEFDHVDVKHVYRDDNARADAVANEAMDGLR